MHPSRPEAWLSSLEEVLRGPCEVVTGDRLLVGVSGGVDSMVLLRGLAELAPAHRWKLVVAHLNHGLRGSASKADERLVRREAERLQLACLVGKTLLSKVGQGESLEMRARSARHQFLARAARSARARKIVLAHHADDQVELFLLRLFRGTGLDALGGMRFSGRSPADASRLLLRPLLGFRKELLLDIARHFKIPFREDASNASLDILRNRVRHELLPLLRREYQAGVDATLLRTMDIVREEAALVQNWGEKLALPFGELPIALQRRRIHAQLLQLGVESDFDKIEVLRKAYGQPVAFGPAPGGLRPRLLVLNADGQVLDSKSNPAFQPDCRELSLEAPGTVSFGGLDLSWEVSRSKAAVSKGFPGREQFDADAVGVNICLRHWNPGDRFWPVGMPKPVKLQDLFTNAKIPRDTRHSLVVACTTSGEIFWVQGLRMSEKFKVRPGTIRRLIWRWQTR